MNEQMLELEIIEERVTYTDREGFNRNLIRFTPVIRARKGYPCATGELRLACYELDADAQPGTHCVSSKSDATIRASIAAQEILRSGFVIVNQ